MNVAEAVRVHDSQYVAGKCLGAIGHIDGVGNNILPVVACCCEQQAERVCVGTKLEYVLLDGPGHADEVRCSCTVRIELSDSVENGQRCLLSRPDVVNRLVRYHLDKVDGGLARFLY